MPNFTWEIKRELLSFPPAEADCAAAFSAFLSTGAHTDGSAVEIVCENERVCQYFFSVAERLNVPIHLKEAARDAKNGADRLVFFCDGERTRQVYIPPPVPKSEEEREAAVAYLRAAFLGGGSCTLPHGDAKTGYHLEFQFDEEETAGAFCELLDGIDLYGRYIPRGDKTVVYLKSREAISDFLFISGAKTALKRLNSVSEAREERNNANRVGNCFSGNADRTATASARQVYEIGELKNSEIWAALPPDLKETAKLRTEFPTLSLAELAQKMGVTKSCLNHRMRKLQKIYAESVKRI